jgi:hypothetical protein
MGRGLTKCDQQNMILVASDAPCALGTDAPCALGTLHVISCGLVGWEEDILPLNCGFLVTSINHESQVVMHLGSFECCVHGM